MNAQERFDEMVLGFAPVLKGQGFSRRSSTFYKRTQGNWAVINFQKSQASSSAEVLFTLNLGIASTTLMKYRGKDPNRPPPHSDCDWSQRIGALLAERKDLWWSISSQTDLAALETMLGDVLLATAIPELEKWASDTALRDLWSAGASPGLTNFSRLVALATLIKEIGPSGLLRGVLDELVQSVPGGTSNPSVSYYLKKLRPGAEIDHAE